MQKPNVLILMCDQMQAKRMGFIDGIAHTPNLDALAKEGVHFPNAITIHGQCAPSRCAFMTGMSPHECNVMANVGFHGHTGHLTTKNRTFVQEFQENGYTTAHFGKSHLGFPLRTLGFDVGECLDGNFPEGTEPIERINAKEELEKTKAEGYKKGGHYQYLEDGLNWLSQYEPNDKPLFYMFDTNFPHPPFDWQDEFKEKFKPEDMILPKSYYDETFENKPAFFKEHVDGGPHKLEDEEKLRIEMAQYYTMISATDKACGQIIDQFKEKGLWDNTIVLFFTDHGDMMGAHRIRRKGTMPYEELYNIPCIMKLPTGKSSKRAVIEEPIISTDLPGALLDLAGIKSPEPFSNSKIIGCFDREEALGDEKVFFEHYAAWWGLHPFYGVRTKNLKYVRYYGDDNTEEMYDLVKDPHELHNIVNDASYNDQYKSLSSQANHWWRSTGGKNVEYYESDAFKANVNQL